MPIIEPFVRWAGGKSWFIPHLIDIISSMEFNHFHEPFLGGAAIFLALDHKKKAYLSDINEELINAYIQIRDNPNQVIERLICLIVKILQQLEIIGQLFLKNF